MFQQNFNTFNVGKLIRILSTNLNFCRSVMNELILEMNQIVAQLKNFETINSWIK